MLVEELHSHENNITSISREGRELLSDGHFASDHIEESLQKLLDAWQDLNTQTEERSKNLENSLHLQQVINH